MAINRVYSVCVLSCLFFLPYCSSNAEREKTAKSNNNDISEQFRDKKRNPDVDTIAVLTPATTSTYELWKSLGGELGEEFNIRTMIMSADTSTSQINEYMKKSKPVAVVLIDNSTVKKYRDYQKQQKGESKPVFIFMASFLNEIIGMVRNANGIAYEVPGVLSMVRVRNILDTRVIKVGAVHRKAFDNYVKQEQSMMKVEKFQFYTASVSDRPDLYEVEAALDELINKKKVDVLWILNDNALLKQEFLSDIWLPTLQNSPMPTVVNVPVLLNPEIQFGTIAVVPDSSALGVQAANMIFNAYDMNWEMEENYVEQPLSVLTFVDEANVTTNFSLKKNAGDYIDKLL